MRNEPGRVLYTREILALTVSLADWPMREDFGYKAELRSKSCGSVVRVGLDCDADGIVRAFGVGAHACALGQASAAVMAKNILGRTAGDLTGARDDLAAFLSGKRADPGEWPGVHHLASALPYPARHASILLPWRAAVAALQP